MAWDESLFGWLFDRVRRRPRRGTAALDLGPHTARLAVVAAWVAERPVQVQLAAGAPGWSGASIRLPATLDLCADPAVHERLALWCTLHQAAAVRLGLVTPTAVSQHPAAGFVAATLGVPLVLGLLEQDAPGTRSLWNAVCADASAWLPARPADPLTALAAGRVGTAASHPWQAWVASSLGWPVTDGSTWRSAVASALGAAPAGAGTAAPPWTPWGLCAAPGPVVALNDEVPDGTRRPSTERERRSPARPVERVEVVDEQNENPVIHSFEKVHTADDYAGGNKRVDDSDELAEHEAALDEMAMDRVMRSRSQAASIYRADLLLAGHGSADGGALAGGVPYPEWDEGRGLMRHDWCRVLTSVAVAADGAAAAAETRRVVAARAAEVRTVRARLTQVLQTRRPAMRQLDGPELDLHAVVDHLATLAAGGPQVERLYARPRAALPDAAVLLLLDASLSMDSWVANRRLADAARETVVVLGAALEGILSRVGVAGFWSETRHACHMATLKGFEEAWSTCHARMLGLQPTGYTRIGPAIRHATRVLGGTGARRRALVVVSDGNPTDYDHYEGAYGLADVRQAVTAARADGVVTCGIGLGARSAAPIHAMFSRTGGVALGGGVGLPEALGGLIAGLARR